MLAFLKKAVQPHRDREVHVVLDNLSTHTTPEVMAWLARNPRVSFHFTPVGSSWINRIETWFGIITRQSIRRGTFTSVTVLIKQIRDYIEHRNSDPKPFSWTATADEILAKVQLVQTSIRKLVNNNAKYRQRDHATPGRRVRPSGLGLLAAELVGSLRVQFRDSPFGCVGDGVGGADLGGTLPTERQQ